jgi:hypothetical protein
MGLLAGAVAVFTAIVGFRQSQREMETLKETTDKQADVQLAMIEFKKQQTEQLIKYGGIALGAILLVVLIVK